MYFLKCVSNNVKKALTNGRDGWSINKFPAIYTFLSLLFSDMVSERVDLQREINGENL